MPLLQRFGTHAQCAARHDGRVAETVGDANVREILAYHEATKHSPESIRRIRWQMDWSNKPDPFKRYPGLPEIRLERPAAASDRAELDAIADVSGGSRGAVDRHAIARVLTWGAGLHHAVQYPGGETFFFRTYASAGALYPVEVYSSVARLRDSRRASTTTSRTATRSSTSVKATTGRASSAGARANRRSPTRRPSLR